MKILSDIKDFWLDKRVSLKYKIFMTVFYTVGISSLIAWFLIFAVGFWQIESSGLILDLGK